MLGTTARDLTSSTNGQNPIEMQHHLIDRESQGDKWDAASHTLDQQRD